MNDNLNKMYEKFLNERSPKRLHDRFPGRYRALVVDTNDPLNMHRIRFLCPEMHNKSISASDAPWASPSFQHGGKGCGSWSSPCIGDIVWIGFEKQHPYGPIWLGHAEPTRRRYYKLHALYQKTNIYVDETGKPLGTDIIPTEWEFGYLPKDGRPYSSGISDRYGNIFMMDMTGFVPSEHKQAPSLNGIDSIASSNTPFKQSSIPPISNNPDLKMITIASKCGHYFIIGDQGYKWDQEFTGNFDLDHSNEINRVNNLKKLLNENKPSGRDQRRIEFRSDYGHKLEMRDVGWSSLSGYSAKKKTKVNSISRPDDLFKSSMQKSNSTDNDERWIKLRTKGGMLIQFMDMGFDPQEDTFIRKSRLNDIGSCDNEGDWQNRDARQVRIISRHGFKFVIDDRGSDAVNGDVIERQHGNGILLKGRRLAMWNNYVTDGINESTKNRVITPVSPASPAYIPKFSENQNTTNNGRGFGIDVNEKNDLNRMMLYSPLSKVLELNDRYGYVFLSTDMKKSVSEPWKYKSENEFSKTISMAADDPESNTYSLKLDRSNTYACLTTPTNQAFEARDGWSPESEAFIEMRDMDERALVLSKSLKLSALHDPSLSKYVILEDRTNMVMIHNQIGKIQIYARGDVEVISDSNIRHTCKGAYNINCATFTVNAGSGHFSVTPGLVGSNVPVNGPIFNGTHTGCMSGSGGGSPAPVPKPVPPAVVTVAPPMVPLRRKFKSNISYTSINDFVIQDTEQI
jgi:hypothetical protein